jgi:hypothetical protein
MTDPRIECSEEERQALGVYRQALSPSDAQVKAALSGVSASLGLSLVDAGVAQGATSQAPLSAVQQSASVLKGAASAFDVASRAVLVKTSLGALALGGVVAAYGILEPFAPNADMPRTPPSAWVVPAESRPTAAPPKIADEPTEVPATELADLPEAIEPRDAPAQPRKVPPIATPASAPAPPRSDSSHPVHDELSAVRRAQSVLAAGHPAQALRLLEAYGEANPGGNLLVERELTRVLALCELGRRAEAREAAARVEQLPGGAAYRTRLVSSCAGTPSQDNEPIESPR